jgi:hypothetical protein
MTELRTPPVATAFDLDELRMEHDRVVVRGRWSGTRGMRFMRPTLLVGDREVLATLDHKPWAPDAGALWTAAFPWEGPAIEPFEAALAVTNGVTVPLVPGGGPDPAPVVPPEKRGRLDAVPAWEAPPVGAPTAPEPDPVPARMPEPESEPEPARAAAATDPVPEFLSEATTPDARESRELAAVRRRLEHAERERDEALAEQRRLREQADDAVAAQRRAETDRDEAIAERRRADGWAEQQNRHVSTVQRDAEKVIAEREAALAAQRHAERERDDAERRAAQAREARDETLVAFRALERRQRVGEQPAEHEPAGEPTAVAPAPEVVAPERTAVAGEIPSRAELPRRDEEEDLPADEPLGIVALPAARDLAADLHHVDRLSARPVTAFDVWAVRILGSVAACCFLGLLLLLMLTFV